MSNQTISMLLQASRDVEAWCASEQFNLSHRTQVLQPAIAELPTFGELRDVLESVAARRRDLLTGPLRPQLTGGRLLACEFNSSVDSGESEHASGGFFDIHDRPRSDTWVSVLESESGDPILLSWVPAALVDRVEAGIATNPYGCIYWLQDAPPSVARLPMIRALTRATEATI